MNTSLTRFLGFHLHFDRTSYRMRAQDPRLFASGNMTAVTLTISKDYTYIIGTVYNGEMSEAGTYGSVWTHSAPLLKSPTYALAQHTFHALSHKFKLASQISLSQPPSVEQRNLPE